MTNNDDKNKDDIKMIEEVDEVKELREKLEMCERERDEYLAGWRRSKADHLNYKAEEMKRLEDVVKYGNEEIIKGMLSVLQSFELAKQSIKDEKGKEGIEHIRNQLEEVLRRHGLQKIEVKVGDKFNPEFHEALMQEEIGDKSSSEHEIILEELSSGYMLHGKVINTTKVKVTK